MAEVERTLTWRERARRVREGEPALADLRAEEPYESFQDLFATILRRSFDAVVLCTREGEYLEVSDSFCELTGYGRAELLGQTSVTLSLVDPDGVRRRMEHEVAENIKGIYDNVIVRKDATPRVVEFSHQYLDGDLTLVIIRDVTERRLREQELDRLSREDALTGALNRRGFAALVGSLLDDARRDARTVQLVVADVDGLKEINDDLGHESGDRTLVAVATALRQCYGPDAVVGRLGGDEFAVAFTGGTTADVEAAADRLFDILSRSEIGPDSAVRPVSVSIGVAAAVHGIGTVERLIAVADENQYVAKRARHTAAPPANA